MTTKDPRHYDVILAPVITEKATMASENSQVMFRVAANATKPQIKEAVEKLFDVKVKRVNTLIRKGKVRNFRGVRGDATKPQIKEAVEKLFDVKVKSVNTLIRKGKVRRFRGKRGQLSDVKKAFVTLEEGHRIDVATGL